MSIYTNEKVKIVVKRKIVVETDNSTWQAPKKRKKRKPMTEDQRQASAKRLEKVRAARTKKDPTYGQGNIHESIRNLPDDHKISPRKVKEWINTQKEYISAERASVRANIKGAKAKLVDHQGYVKEMQKYLKTGDWISCFYGKKQEHKTKYRSVALGYYWYGPRKGEVKRSIDVYYPDMGCVYTQEMLEEDREMQNVRRKREEKR